MDIAPAKADIDVAALEPVAAVKNALIAVESSDDRRIDARRVAPVDPPYRPCSRRGIESANAETAIFAVRKVEDIVVDRAEPAEGRPARALAAEFGPIVAPPQPLLHPPVPDIPISAQPTPSPPLPNPVRGG